MSGFEVPASVLDDEQESSVQLFKVAVLVIRNCVCVCVCVCVCQCGCMCVSVSVCVCDDDQGNSVQLLEVKGYHTIIYHHRLLSSYSFNPLLILFFIEPS